MAGKRIYEGAKQYQISSEALMALLKELQFQVKSHMGSVTEEMLVAIEEKFKKEKEIVKKEMTEKQRKQKERERAEALGLQVKDPFLPSEPGAAVPDEKETELDKLSLRKKEELLRQERAREAVRRGKERFRPDVKQDKLVAQKRAEESVKKTLSQLDLSRRPKKYVRKEEEVAEVKEEPKVIKVSEFISVAELATLMNLRPAQGIPKCV